MSTLVLEAEPIAMEVDVTNEELIVTLTDGRRISVPLAWYPRLLHASPAERQNWQLLETAMPLNGPTWMSTLASKACWPGDPAARVSNRCNVG